MANLAVQLAEKQLRDGSASPTVVVHYLKLATLEHEIQMQKLENEAKLAAARADAIASNENIAKLYGDAIKYFGSYQTGEDVDDDDDH